MWSKSGDWYLAAAIAALSSPVSADSLGFRFAEVSVAAQASEFPMSGQIHATADFAITKAHGVQFDFAAVGYQGEFLGQLDGHIYMMPTDAAKYGLYFSLADMNGREATIASVGVEAMFAVSPGTEVQGRAGIGMALPGNIDFITVSVGASHAFSDQLAVFGDLSMAELDEAALRAMATTARVGISYQPQGQSWEISGALSRDGLTGRDASRFENRAELALTLHLGAGGGAKRGLSKRRFSAPQPFDPLLRRGLF